MHFFTKDQMGLSENSVRFKKYGKITSDRVTFYEILFHSVRYGMYAESTFYDSCPFTQSCAFADNVKIMFILRCMEQKYFSLTLIFSMYTLEKCCDLAPENTIFLLLNFFIFTANHTNWKNLQKNCDAIQIQR